MGMRTTLSLLAIVATLVTVLLCTREQPSDRGAVSLPLLGGDRIQAAVRLQWQFADTAPVEVRREPGGPFRLTLPLEDLLSAGRLQSIADAYNSAQIGETPLADTPDNRARTGLATPRLVVDLEFESRRQLHLEIGAEGPHGTDVFVRKDGRIWRGSLALLSTLQVGIEDLRERTVFVTRPEFVEQLTIDRGMPSGQREALQLVRAGERWELHQPIRARADFGAAESLVRVLMGMQIDSFPDGVVALPDGEADIVVRVRAGGREETLSLWRDSTDNLSGRLEHRRIWFRVLQPQYVGVFVVNLDVLRARILIPSGNLYSECLLIAVDPGDGGARTVLRRAAPDQPWRLQEPVSAPVEASRVNELLQAITELQALAFLPPDTDPKAQGLRSDGPSVSVQCVEDPLPVVVRLGNEGRLGEHDVVYAGRQDGLAEVVAVARSAVQGVRRPWTQLLPSRLFRIDTAVVRVDLHRGAERRRLLADGAGRWTASDGRPVASDEVADCVDRLRDLTVKSLAAARDKSLAAPDWTLVMLRPDDADDERVGLGAIEVWDRPGQPLLVRSSTGVEGVVGELSPTDSRNLRALWQ